MVETYIPSNTLKRYINSYKIVSSQDGVTNRVLPDTSVALGIRISGSVNYMENNSIIHLPASLLSGMRKSPRLINYAPGSAMLIILFKEDGANAFFPVPIFELFEQSVSLQHLMAGYDVKLIEEAIACANSSRERIAIIETFLLSRLRVLSPDQLISAAISSIRETNGVIRIAKLAKDLYISEDALSKRFRKVTGSTAKQYAAIIRMKSVIDIMKSRHSFTDAALEAGFFDQSHFNKEFKNFTGLNPAAFLRTGPRW